MNLCIVSMTGIYPVDIGGPASVAYFLAKELGELENEIDLYIRAKDEKHLEEINSCRELQELKNAQIIPTKVKYNFLSLINFFSLLFKIRSVSNVFTDRNYDIVHYNSPPVDVTLRFPSIAKSKNEKQTLAVHGGLFYESKNYIGKWLIKRKHNIFQKIVVLNNFSKKLALEVGFNENKIVAIPNGVDLETMNRVKPLKLAGEPRILYTGRLAKVKGLEILFHAFTEIVESHPEAMLYIVGDGPQREQMVELARKLKLQKNVSFEGFVKKTTDVYRFYKSVDMFILPSYKENFSISLLEAMGLKVPIIASDAEGNVELIKNGENGLIFPKGDSGELGEKMQLILSDRTMARRLTSNAYDLIEKWYNWTRIAHAYNEMFQSLLK